MAGKFRLALKMQPSNVRTDTDRTAGLMKDTRTGREANESSLPVEQALPQEQAWP
jgi:hypothetical protein